MAVKTDIPAEALVPFDIAPPDARRCLDETYRALRHHSIDWAWCTQCFGPDDKKRMRDHGDVGGAPPDAFSAIYFEHPACSGGETTFLHWLPRGIELQFFSRSIDPNLTVQMVRLGLLAWPEAEKQALRRLFCRIALDWWTSAQVAPLQILPNGGFRIDDRRVGLRLMEVLCALQVDMRSVATVLLDIDTPTAWLSLVDAFQSQTLLEEPVFYLLPDERDEVIFRKARAALDRRARCGISAMLSREAPVARWEQASNSTSRLADILSDAELLFDVYHLQQSDAEAREDEDAIRAAVRCASAR